MPRMKCLELTRKQIRDMDLRLEVNNRKKRSFFVEDKSRYLVGLAYEDIRHPTDEDQDIFEVYLEIEEEDGNS